MTDPALGRPARKAQGYLGAACGPVAELLRDEADVAAALVQDPAARPAEMLRGERKRKTGGDANRPNELPNLPAREPAPAAGNEQRFVRGAPWPGHRRQMFSEARHRKPREVQDPPSPSAQRQATFP